MSFGNRKPKASFDRGSPAPSAGRSSFRSNTAQVQTEDKPVWLTIANITPTRYWSENSEDYNHVVNYFKSTGCTFVWDTWFGKGNDQFEFLHKDVVRFNFRVFEDDPDFVIGQVSMKLEEEGKWVNLGKINATKKGSSNPEYVELAQFLRTSGFTFTAKIWLKDAQDKFVIKAREKLILNFRTQEGDKDFVVGKVTLKQ